MKGDYLRYLSEVANDDALDKGWHTIAFVQLLIMCLYCPSVKEESEVAYEEADKKAQDLKSTHPIRLGLALNFSVFYYEILQKPDKACELAKKASFITDFSCLKVTT